MLFNFSALLLVWLCVALPVFFVSPSLCEKNVGTASLVQEVIGFLGKEENMLDGYENPKGVLLRGEQRGIDQATSRPRCPTTCSPPKQAQTLTTRPRPGGVSGPVKMQVAKSGV
ncbi:hypothetical protein VTI74DRAFT_518 [Chaetomium olivicolor]